MTVVAAIVPAAGAGQRLGAGVPKAMALLAGEPILAHAVRGLVAEPRVGLVVVAAPPELVADVAAVVGPCAGTVPVRVVSGGATRVESVARGLVEVVDADVVLVHDAARCLVPPAVIARVIDAVLAGAPGVVPAVPVVDTLREVTGTGSRTVDRSAFRAVQTPQGFAVDVLRRAHARGGAEATDDAGMVEALGLAVTLVDGDPLAFKVTTPLDLELAEALLRSGGRR